MPPGCECFGCISHHLADNFEISTVVKNACSRSRTGTNIDRHKLIRVVIHSLAKLECEEVYELTLCADSLIIELRL